MKLNMIMTLQTCGSIMNIFMLTEVFVFDVSALGFTTSNLHTRRSKEVWLNSMLQGWDTTYPDEPGKYQIVASGYLKLQLCVKTQ